MMDWSALQVSLWLAFFTVAVLLPSGILMARAMSRMSPKIKPWFDALILFPLLLPPTVLGFYFLNLYGESGLNFTFIGLLFANILINVPFMVQPIERALSAISSDLREAAWLCGLSPWQCFVKVELALAWPGVLAGVALTIAHTLGEFGVVLMVGGNIPGQTRTMSIAIYDKVQALDYTAAHWMSLLLVAVSLLALLVVSLGHNRSLQRGA